MFHLGWWLRKQVRLGLNPQNSCCPPGQLGISWSLRVPIWKVGWGNRAQPSPCLATRQRRGWRSKRKTLCKCETALKHLTTYATTVMALGSRTWCLLTLPAPNSTSASWRKEINSCGAHSCRNPWVRQSDSICAQCRLCTGRTHGQRS